MAPKRRSLQERFWDRVDKAGDCWEWTGSTNGVMGYGRVSEGGRKSKQLATHRLSWEMHYGPIPAGLYVCHKCDNPKCVRPDHLFIGTAAENSQDRARKGRNKNQYGSNNTAAKLSADDVAEIRTATAPQRIVAQQFGVSQANISLIRSGKTW